MPEKNKNRDFWEIRLGKVTLCSSTVPFLGYPAHTLLDMYAAGYTCYRNGNRVKKCELASA